MTLEARPNQPNPEGISAQQQERFLQLQTDILGRLKPRPSRIIVITSDSIDPVAGYHLSLDKDGGWSFGFGRGGIKYLNGPNKPPDKPLETFGKSPSEPEEPVQLLDLLNAFAFIQHSGELDQTELDPQFSIKRYSDKLRALRRSVKESVENNPGPFAESFFKHMESALEQLSKEEDPI